MVLTDRELLARLVGFDSVSPNSNLPIVEFICDYLDRPGVTLTRCPGTADDKVNLVVTAGPEDGGGLAFSGHLDVVPAGEAGWSSDPFVLTDSGGNYVGRGACDMKGSIALAVNTLAAADTAALRRPFALLLTCDEELGTLGAQRFAQSWPDDRPLPRSVLVGEPTSLRAVRMHKGHLTMRITVRGTAAHTGSPHLGVNAIESAARLVQALARLAEVFKQKRGDTSAFFPAVPYSVLAVSGIRGGTAVNVVPEQCVIDAGLRLLPGMNVDAAVEWVRDAAVKSVPAGRVEFEVANNSPPMLTADGAELHQALCRALGQRNSLGVSFASDGGPLSTRGFECVLFGPGSIEVAHRPNEYVPADELARAKDVLGALVERFCAG